VNDSLPTNSNPEQAPKVWEEKAWRSENGFTVKILPEVQADTIGDISNWYLTVGDTADWA
jgi:hypothetical protein